MRTLSKVTPSVARLGAGRRAVQGMILVTAQDARSGGLVVVPGSHRDHESIARRYGDTSKAAGAWLVEEEGGAHRRLAVPPERLALMAPSTALAGQEKGPLQSRAVALLQVPYGVLAADGDDRGRQVRCRVLSARMRGPFGGEMPPWSGALSFQKGII